MRKVMLLALVGAGVLLTGMVGTSSAQTTFAGTPIPVKFVCGVERPNPNLTPPAEPPVKPGNYATVINVENLSALTDSNGDPEATSVVWTVSMPGLTSPGVGTPISLAQFATGDITCAQIARAVSTVATNGFITGYVNIGSNPQADLAVTAVYTSQGCTFPIFGSLIPGLGCSGPVSIDVIPERLAVPFINQPG